MEANNTLSTSNSATVLDKNFDENSVAINPVKPAVGGTSRVKKPKSAKASAADILLKKENISRRYFEGIGRRKRSVARVRIFTTNPKDSAQVGNFTVNGKNLKEYFRELFTSEVAMESLNKLKASDHFKISAQVSGGGMNAQAEAVRLGVARALVKFDANFRKKLKKASLLRRDPREKERRKYGLKKARRAPQFSKR